MSFKRYFTRLAHYAAYPGTVVSCWAVYHGIQVHTFCVKAKDSTLQQWGSFKADTVTDIKRLNSDSSNMRNNMELLIMQTQKDVCDAIESVESMKSDRKFLVDRWIRPEGGGGISCVMQDGEVFEKAGVNISVVHGNLPPSALAQMRARGKVSCTNDALKHKDP